jgi:hypothetical protein
VLFRIYRETLSRFSCAASLAINANYYNKTVQLMELKLDLKILLANQVTQENLIVLLLLVNQFA